MNAGMGAPDAGQASFKHICDIWQSHNSMKIGFFNGFCQFLPTIKIVPGHSAKHQLNIWTN